MFQNKPVAFPSDPNTYNNLARSYIELSNLSSAEHCYNLSLNINPMI